MESIEVLKGKTLSAIDRTGESLTFITTDGERYLMDHCQDCCESVTIEDIAGDLEDLIGSPVLEAEESTSNENPKDSYDDSFTWTFYKLGTIKGHVTIRWYGSSNGYYSERVDIRKL